MFLVTLLVTLAMGCSFEPSYQGKFDQENNISNACITCDYDLQVG